MHITRFPNVTFHSFSKFLYIIYQIYTNVYRRIFVALFYRTTKPQSFIIIASGKTLFLLQTKFCIDNALFLEEIYIYIIYVYLYVWCFWNWQLSFVVFFFVGLNTFLHQSLGIVFLWIQLLIIMTPSLVTAYREMFF